MTLAFPRTSWVVCGLCLLIAATAKRAPAWMQENGLDWLFRFTHEPRRLWRRYLVKGSKFVWNVSGAFGRGEIRRIGVRCLRGSGVSGWLAGEDRCRVSAGKACARLQGTE